MLSVLLCVPLSSEAEIGFGSEMCSGARVSGCAP